MLQLWDLLMTVVPALSHHHATDSPVVGADDANQNDRAQDVDSCNAHCRHRNAHEVEGLGSLCCADL